MSHIWQYCTKTIVVWSKRCEAAQTVDKPGVTARKSLLCIWTMPGHRRLRVVTPPESLSESSWLEVLMHPPYSPDPDTMILLPFFLHYAKLPSRVI
ncbi:hypothetical protein TNCV_2151341 [Trichonephila clavipes]|nr:hypothetical protein TNCV_2151341 [Trichonephila clavipes]